jgi:rubrerythrin
MVKRAMTRSFLEDAFAGESKAHMKYLIFAEKAEKDGLVNLARMYKAIAHAEFTHARNHFKALGYLGSTVENLKSGADGENFEIEEMYPVYKNSSEFQTESEAVRSCHFALEAEKIHEKMYLDAIEVVKDGNDIKDSDFYICNICGYTTEDNLPEKCPVCGASKELFMKF